MASLAASNRAGDEPDFFGLAHSRITARALRPGFPPLSLFSTPCCSCGRPRSSPRCSDGRFISSSFSLCLFFSFPAVLEQLMPQALETRPITVCVMGLLLARAAVALDAFPLRAGVLVRLGFLQNDRVFLACSSALSAPQDACGFSCSASCCSRPSSRPSPCCNFMGSSNCPT